MMRFLVSEADVLEEQELHDGYTLDDLLIYMRGKNIPSA
jgi:hypothetical protein